MARPVGPTIPRWQLGHHLSRLRNEAGIDQKTVAKEVLACSINKVQKIEGGDVGTKKAELEVMLAHYGVDDPKLCAELEDLRSLGTQRGWWAKYGSFNPSFADFLGLETAARVIRVYEPMVVYGLIQTPEYARAVTEACNPSMDPGEVERQVKIRLVRQQVIFGEDPPQVWVLLDEAVLHRPVGGAQVMADQLQHLLDLPKNITLQVVPFSAGGHPGTLGAITTFEFDPELHSPVGYIECQGGNLYLEKEPEVNRCLSAYGHIAASALNKQESAKLIGDKIRQYTDSTRSST